MKPKKNPKKDLSRNSSLYFVIGLLCVLSLTFIALEWKSFENNYDPDIAMNMPEINIEEEAPIFQLEATPPPKPKFVPIEINVAEDDEQVTEDVIEAIEPNPDTKVTDISDYDVVEEEPEVEVNWVTVEEVPVFPGCENEKDKRACFNKMMQKHIQKNFRYPEMAQEMGLQGRVSTQFIINKDGSIGTIRKRGPHALLEEEAARILSKLPKMKPGKQRGTAVKVPFQIPITFKLQ